MKTGRNMEDMALLSSLRKGEQQAFDSLFRKYYPMLCAYARRFVELEDAEEIVQEIMLWIWEKHSELIIESSLSQYLFKMTYHRALNLIAKKEIINRAEAVFYTKNQEMPEDVNYYQIKELTKRIEKAIAALPESYQTAFIMHRFKGRTTQRFPQNGRLPHSAGSEIIERRPKRLFATDGIAGIAYRLIQTYNLSYIASVKNSLNKIS